MKYRGGRKETHEDGIRDAPGCTLLAPLTPNNAAGPHTRGEGV